MRECRTDFSGHRKAIMPDAIVWLGRACRPQSRGQFHRHQPARRGPGHFSGQPAERPALHHRRSVGGGHGGRGRDSHWRRHCPGHRNGHGDGAGCRRCLAETGPVRFQRDPGRCSGSDISCGWPFHVGAAGHRRRGFDRHNACLLHCDEDLGGASAHLSLCPDRPGS